MTQRIWNFSAGPAVLPESVLEEAGRNLLSLGDSGIGILEHSHRGKAFLAVYEETEALVREVGGVPSDYKVLFLQGGASTQFFQIPMNFLTADRTADYLMTGSWSEKPRKKVAVSAPQIWPVPVRIRTIRIFPRSVRSARTLSMFTTRQTTRFSVHNGPDCHPFPRVSI